MGIGTLAERRCGRTFNRCRREVQVNRINRNNDTSNVARAIEAHRINRNNVTNSVATESHQTSLTGNTPRSESLITNISNSLSSAQVANSKPASTNNTDAKMSSIAEPKTTNSSVNNQVNSIINPVNTNNVTNISNSLSSAQVGNSKPASANNTDAKISSIAEPKTTNSSVNNQVNSIINPVNTNNVTNISNSLSSAQVGNSKPASANNTDAKISSIAEPKTTNSSVNNQVNLSQNPDDIDFNFTPIDFTPFHFDFDFDFDFKPIDFEPIDLNLDGMLASITLDMNKVNGYFNSAGNLFAKLQSDADSATKTIKSGVNLLNKGMNEMISGVNGAVSGMNEMISGVNGAVSGIDNMISDVKFINKTVDSLISSENQISASQTTKNTNNNNKKNNNLLYKGKDMDETSLLGGVSNFTSAVTGSIGSQLSKIEKTDTYTGYVNKDGVITSVLPHQDTTTPLKVLGKTGTFLTIATTGADIANTVSANNGNTNAQKVIKAGIQVAGVVVSGEISGAVTAALIPETGPYAVVGGIATDAAVSDVVDHVEDFIYKKLNIK